MLAFLLTACIETGLSDPSAALSSAPPSAGAELITETRRGPSARDVDVLFILDSGCSMEEQFTLRQAAPPLLDHPPGRLRVGVIDGSPERGEEGPLREFDGRRWVSSGEDGAADRLDALLDVGDGGSWDDRYFDAAHAALTDPVASTWNADFRRADADLHLVFLATEDDESDTTPTRLLQTLDVLSPPAHTTTAWALAGGAEGCPTGQRSPRLDQLTEATGGVTRSVCASDFQPFIDELSVGLGIGPVAVPLSHPADPTTLEVLADDGASTYVGVPDDAPAGDLPCAVDACFRYGFDPVRNAVVLHDLTPGPDTTLTFRYLSLRRP